MRALTIFLFLSPKNLSRIPVETAPLPTLLANFSLLAIIQMFPSYCQVFGCEENVCPACISVYTCIFHQKSAVWVYLQVYAKTSSTNLSVVDFIVVVISKTTFVLYSKLFFKSQQYFPLWKISLKFLIKFD